MQRFDDPTEVIPTADLALAKTASPDPGYVGETLTYTLTLTNQGPDDAENLVLTDTLWASVDYLGSDLLGLPCPDPVDGELVCTLDQLASGDSATLTVWVTPMVVENVENHATLSASTVDLDDSDNNADINHH